MTITDPDYWLSRFGSTMENARGAPGERSRLAYLELARHYWAMHLRVNGRPDSPPPQAIAAEAGDFAMELAA